VFLGSPAFWPVWLVGTIVLIAIVILSHEAREEEEDEEETAQEIIRDLDTDHSTRAGSPRPRRLKPPGVLEGAKPPAGRLTLGNKGWGPKRENQGS
jgi:hypothetical protein